MPNDIDQKIGQMIMVGFRGSRVNDDSSIIRQIKKYHVGGVWIVDNENPMGESIGNITSKDQLKHLTTELQSNSKIPLLTSIDAEGGRVIRLKEAYGFPKTSSAQKLGEMHDLTATYIQSLQIAGLLKEVGVNLNLAPVVDLYLNKHNPALGGKERCYSADPTDVTEHARKVIEAHHKMGVACCLKHFPGHGSSADDTHLGHVDVSNTWTEKEIIPYQHLIDEGLADSILTAHIFNRNFDENYPATLSHKVITGLLRVKMNFNGVVISDDILMGAISDNYGYELSIELAVNAGVDIVLQSNIPKYDENNAEVIFNVIKKGVNEGRIKKERIEEAYGKVMQLKSKITREFD